MADYITTQSMVRFDPLNPHVEDIHIEDIAHALSHLCRATGHFFHFYSVAQHCINCSIEATARGYSTRVQLACLLHDACEAYLGDMADPIKNKMPGYRKAERVLQDMIYQKYLDVAPRKPEQVQIAEIDGAVLHREFSELLEQLPFTDPSACHAKLALTFQDFELVRFAFIRRFYGLFAQLNGESNPSNEVLKKLR